MDIPTFKTKKELFDFLVENKSTLIAQKKSEMKRADAFTSHCFFIEDTGNITKANAPILNPGKLIKTRLIINTTNLMDSHDDVHLPGLWNKSLKENRNIMHLQEHKMAFDSIISEGDDLKAYTKNYAWSDLGYKADSETQALVFDSNVRKNRNEFMHDQYSKGFVKNHSVGMHYVKLVLAINDEDHGAEFEAWEKYYPMIVNKELADAKGYFWAVKEAKVIEGSAVPLGSNHVTPTLENDIKSEPLESTQDEPPEGTLTIEEYKTTFKNILNDGKN